MIRALLTDLDNTLVDFISFKERTAMAAAKAMAGHGVPGGAGEAYRRIFEVYDGHGMEFEKTYFEVVSSYRLPDLNMAERLQQAAIVAHQQAMPEALGPYPMAQATLDELGKAGIRRVLVSDGPRNKAWKRLVLSGLCDSLDLVITHDDTGAYKPDNAPFERASSMLGLHPCQCMFVGDNPSRDMEGARRMGMVSVLALYGAEGARPYDKRREYRALEQADYRIRRFDEVLRIIGRLNGMDELIRKRESFLWKARGMKERGVYAARSMASSAGMRLHGIGRRQC